MTSNSSQNFLASAARVNFSPAQIKDSLLVPTEAVIQTGRRAVVIVADEEGRFTPVDVDIGMESNGETEIRRGLRAGQRVVTSGQFLIDSEASLKGVTSRLGSASETTGEAEPVSIGTDGARSGDGTASHAHGAAGVRHGA